jgi:low affinity Fe/Cu permease
VQSTKSKSWFTRFAKWTARVAGRPATFALAVTVILAWAVTGPLFGFSDTWQLVINTGTTIVTFLMVFLIQNTQNRDTEALHVKLDELIRASRGAHNALLDLEELDEEELDRIRGDYEALAEKARVDLQGGVDDVDVPEIEHEKDGRRPRRG